jgi:hypothetical protein
MDTCFGGETRRKELENQDIGGMTDLKGYMRDAVG